MPIASSGTSTLRVLAELATRIVPNSPGVSSRSGFGSTARARIVPVPWSTRLSMKSSFATRVGSFSSVSPISAA